VNEHPVASRRPIVLQQPQINCASRAEHIDNGRTLIARIECHNFAWYCQAHAATSACIVEHDETALVIRNWIARTKVFSKESDVYPLNDVGFPAQKRPLHPFPF
jgi:hypothetical protein